MIPSPIRRTVQQAHWHDGAGHRTLTIRDVRTIRRRWKATLGRSALAILRYVDHGHAGIKTTFARRELARLKRRGLVVSLTTIMQVVTRESWDWVPDA